MARTLPSFHAWMLILLACLSLPTSIVALPPDTVEVITISPVDSPTKLGRRSEEKLPVQIIWCAKPNLAGDCPYATLPASLLDTGLCGLLGPSWGWASMMLNDTAYQFDLFRDAYCLRRAAEKVSRIDDVAALGVTETNSAYFTLKLYKKV